MAELTAELTAKWFSHFTAILDSSEVREASELTDEQKRLNRESGYRWYDCPCGGADHLATRRYFSEGFGYTLSPVLTCFVTDRQWLVRPADVEAIIRAEEEAYLRVLEKSGPIVKKTIRKMGNCPETWAFLKDTYGIDKEMVEGYDG